MIITCLLKLEAEDAGLGTFGHELFESSVGPGFVLLAAAPLLALTAPR